MSMNGVKGFQAKEIEMWAKKNLVAESAVISGRLTYFSPLSKTQGDYTPALLQMVDLLALP